MQSFWKCFEASCDLTREGLHPSVHEDHVYHSSDECLSQEDRKTAQIIGGKVLFSGHLQLQCGQLIAKGLGCLYPLIKSIKLDRIAFFPFIFFFSYFVGYIMISESTRFDELWLPLLLGLLI